MAGISTAFPFKPSPTTTSPSTRTSSPKLFLSSSFTLKFAAKTTAFRCRVRSVSTTGTVVVVARYGGRGGYRPGPRPSRPPSRGDRGGGFDSDDDALDISRLATNSVRLIDEKQNMVGIVSINEAIQMADDAERDLVILSEDADPPVLRIMDYNKYKYEQQKRKRDQQKKSAATRMDIKELKMGYNIDSHDYSVRLKAAQKFLKDGDKVKIIVNLKGRQNEFRNIAIELIKRFQNDVGELASEESKNFSDRNVFMVLMPNKTVIQKAQEQPKKKDASVNKISANV